MHGEALGGFQCCAADPKQRVLGDPCRRSGRICRDLVLGWRAQDRSLTFTHLVEDCLEAGREVVEGLFGLFEGQVTSANQGLGVELAN